MQGVRQLQPRQHHLESLSGESSPLLVCNTDFKSAYTFYLDECILDELGSSVTYNGKRMYRLHPGTKLKHGARRLHQYRDNKGIKATEIKVKGQTYSPIF